MMSFRALAVAAAGRELDVDFLDGTFEIGNSLQDKDRRGRYGYGFCREEKDWAFIRKNNKIIKVSFKVMTKSDKPQTVEG